MQQKSVYEEIYDVVRLIPRGKVLTYGDVAFLAGNAKMARVVGNALHVNPCPGEIPCHRVVNSKGFPSGSFAFGGAKRQEALLREEGVRFVGEKVDMEQCRWRFMELLSVHETPSVNR